MRSWQGIVKIAILLSLFLGGFEVGATPQKTDPAIPHSKRMLTIDFIIDNVLFMDRDFLEFAIKEDKFIRRFVEIDSVSKTLAGAGRVEISAPEGNLNVVICGFVKCPGDSKSSMVCGEGQIPDYLAFDSTHQLTFSSASACHESGPYTFGY